MKAWLVQTEGVLGRPITLSCLFAVGAGIAAFGWGAASARAPGVFGALIASWLFFAGTAMGAVAFRALLGGVLRARWARELEPTASTLMAFVPVASLLLAVPLIGLWIWAPWTAHAPPARAFWLNAPFFYIREVLGTAALFGMAYYSHRSRGRGEGRSNSPMSTSFAVGFCLVYAVVLSIWSFDFILAADTEWVSSLIGPHLFVGAFSSAVAVITLLAVAQGRTSVFQRDALAKLMFALSVVWLYFFWSQYLPMWYGNLPDEISFLLARSTAPWSEIFFFVLATVFALPFFLLLYPPTRSSSRVLIWVACLVLLGTFAERFLLVVPSLHSAGTPAIDARELVVAIGVLGAFVLTVGRSQREVV
ncbi:MAG: polysulfide reductase NrfD [Deltaproteobacteria bacterium]|nr:polysulfide reductase NrfD [Deltaproteobacteria bacterium]